MSWLLILQVYLFDVNSIFKLSSHLFFCSSAHAAKTLKDFTIFRLQEDKTIKYFPRKEDTKLSQLLG